MKTEKIVNVHTHIHKDQDIAARVKLWRECNVRKVCVQVGSTVDTDERYGNEGVLKWMRKYPDIILGFAHPDLGREMDKSETIDQFRVELRDVGRLHDVVTVGDDAENSFDVAAHECFAIRNLRRFAFAGIFCAGRVKEFAFINVEVDAASNSPCVDVFELLGKNTLAVSVPWGLTVVPNCDGSLAQ